MSGSSVPMPYQPTGQGQADVNYQSLYNTAQPYAANLPSQVVPGVSGQVTNLVNNPYTAGYQAGGTGAGAAYGALAPQQAGAASSLFNAGNLGLGAANTILGTAFDPQNALYAQQYQQMLQQQNAINAQAGVAGSPYAAGITGQAGQNFNLQWLNNQLGRETTGLGAYNTATGAAASDFMNASTLGTGAAQSLLAAGQTPYNVYGTIGANNINAYNALSSATGGALSPAESLMGDLATYLGLGQSATGLAQAGQAQQFQENQSIFQGLGSLLGYGAGSILSGY